MTTSDLANWTPRARPQRNMISGDAVRLEPVDDADHAKALFAAAQGDGGDPALWDYLGYGPFADLAEFTHWVSERSRSEDPLFFAVVDQISNRALGMVSFLRIDEAFGVIEIGHIWFGSGLQKSRGATEAIFLLARYAFDALDYRRLEWKCNNDNARSKRAAERFGFSFEGIFRQHMITKGKNRDTAWFSIIDSEWEAIRTGFERWLADDNFDENGTQRVSLVELRAGAATE
ncbi:MAG: GNAT family protein [Thermomicrobiales bacterium]